jgi:hypothetical protein
MNDDLDILRTLLTTWTDEQLNRAKSMTVEEARRRGTQRAVDNKCSMSPGDMVSWRGNKSGTCTGNIIKVKTKKAIVRDSSTGLNWDVPLSMLTKGH